MRVATRIVESLLKEKSGVFADVLNVIKDSDGWISGEEIRERGISMAFARLMYVLKELEKDGEIVKRPSGTGKRGGYTYRVAR